MTTRNAAPVRSTRSHVGRLLAAALVGAFYFAARLPEPSAAERRELARSFAFTRLPLHEAWPPGARAVRPVHPALRHISAWISSVGAAVALADVDGDGLANDACYVDVRRDEAIVAPVPGSERRPRAYASFVLDPAPLRYDRDTTAPMGCVPGDYDEDGATDLLVYYWGRTPILFLRTASARPPLRGADYARVELAPEGGRWYTNALARADVDGDGHADLVVGNYFPDDSGVLDARTSSGPGPQMQDSMSRAANGGGNRLLLCRPAPQARVECRDASAALDADIAHGWTLAVATADLDGDLLPEIYFANDFGPDRLLHNRSRPGAPRFGRLEGARALTTPASKVLGRDSFKGMGADFGDLDGDGRLDLFVSNIADTYALEESHFAFVATGDADEMRRGRAPFVDRSEPLGLSRSGWAWDARLGDFDNDGGLEVVQALGFLKGEADRWPELHELAMGNDSLLRWPPAWPRFAPGDDLSGGRGLAFFARAGRGAFTDIAAELGLDQSVVTRGVASADVDGDGDLDLAVAGQWGASSLYRNDLPRPQSFLALRLLVCGRGGAAGHTQVADGPRPPAPGCRAAIGAHASVVLAARPGGRPRRLVAQVDGGSGHSGKRSPDLHFGLGAASPRAPLRVELRWRHPSGRPARETLWLKPGWHTLRLHGRGGTTEG